MKRQIAILGSTGSIGTQTLDVIAQNPDKFEVYTITANNNAELLIEQAKIYKPDSVVIANEEYYKMVENALKHLPIKVYAGYKAIAEVVDAEPIDIVVTAMSGYAGLEPTIKAIKAGKTIALANKETLVVAGDLINELAIKHNAAIIPVDSEHSAIFQCLAGEQYNPIDKIILTASGGPFRCHTIEQLSKVTLNDALKHPNWQMGKKITIDSATMINKGFEMIEAKWLFNTAPKDIEVVVHPQSIIHSMVQFEDGSVKAQLGMPDMRLPIAYALSYPKRLVSNSKKLSIKDYSQLTFEAPDTERFPMLAYAYQSIDQGGNIPCALNAANEIAVAAFLNEEIKFNDIPKLVERAINGVSFIAKPTYSDYVDTDKEIRAITLNNIKHNRK